MYSNAVNSRGKPAVSHRKKPRKGEFITLLRPTGRWSNKSSFSRLGYTHLFCFENVRNILSNVIVFLLYLGICFGRMANK